MTSTLRGTAHQIDLPQGTLDYRERGTGNAIVFLHGALCNGDLWRGVVPELADSYRCITPDLPKGSHRIPMHPDADLTPPGMVRLITSFLDGLGLERVTVVANDSGGAVAQMLSAVHPERIDRLILTSCDTFGQFPPRYLKAVHPLSFVPGLGPQVARLWRTKPIRSVFYWSIVKHGLEPGILHNFLAAHTRSEAS
jgi:pimeloyl-ACP methyl ester carboxylesterase